MFLYSFFPRKCVETRVEDPVGVWLNVKDVLFLFVKYDHSSSVQQSSSCLEEDRHTH